VQAAIEIQDLVKRFPQRRSYWQAVRHPFTRSETEVLHQISFSVDQGEIVGLLGPNGAGKTTLIKILCTLLRPTTGYARVNGYDVVREASAVRHSVGYVVADERSFHWRLTGRQNLRFFAALNNLVGTQGRRRVQEVMEIVELEREADEPFLHYSTGTRQRMAIARGLLTDPPILLLDEPTRSLDLPAAQALRGLVRSTLAAQGRTVLIATHNMDEATELCGRVAVIDRGELRAWGTPAELARTVGRVRRRLALTVDGWTGEMLTRVEALTSVLDVHVSGGEVESIMQIEIALDDGSEAVADVIEMIVCSGGRIMALREEQPSLAEIFLSITDRRTSCASGGRAAQESAAEAVGPVGARL
jgi:ABC-2 type transport system ATP-binding protein